MKVSFQSVKPYNYALFLIFDAAVDDLKRKNVFHFAGDIDT